MRDSGSNRPPPAGLLLAGGRSQRMGRDKAQLDWRGQPLGEHQAATLTATGASPLFLSCRPDQPWTPRGFSRIEDRLPFGGVLAAFADAFGATSCEVLLVLAVDLPLVNSAWLATLASRAQTDKTSVVPLHEGRFEPFVAAWHRSAVSALQAALAENESLQSACAGLRNENRLHALTLSVGEAGSLANLNTPADADRLGCANDSNASP